MNPRSDVDFSSPKVDLVVNLREVAIELNREQYISILELLGSVDMMTRNLPYRKYRPDVHVHSNTHIWWRYAITGMLEVDVKPRLHMWSWQHIRQHRATASKAGLCIYRPGVKVEEEETQGWLSWAWNWGEDPEKPKEVETGGFDKMMTPNEKNKLYTAIGYSETAVNPNLPKNFEDMKVNFHLEKLSVSIKGKKDKDEILKLTFRVKAKLSLFEVTGLAGSRPAPTLLSSRKAATATGTPLLSFLFETNPMDQSADQRLHVESQPLEIIYDALEQFRDRTSTGLMYVIETQKVLDLNMNLMASYVIVPQTGFYDATQNLMLLDLGNFKMTSQSKKDLPQLSVGSSTIEDIMSRAYDCFDIQLSSLQFLYSKPDGDWKKARRQKRSPLHVLEPVDLNVVFSRAMVVTDSRMAKFKFSGSLPRLSLRISDVTVRGVLELIESIPLPESRPAPHSTAASKRQSYTPQLTPRRPPNVADLRSSLLFDSCETISITSVGSEEDLFYDAPSSPVGDTQFFSDMPGSLQRVDSVKRRGPVKKDPQKNMTDLEITFEINEMSVQLCRMSSGKEIAVLQLDIDHLGTELSLRSFDMISCTFLREICLKCPEYMDSEDKEVQLITTLDNSKDDLLTLEYTKADRNGPEFKTLHHNTEQLIKVTFSSLDVHLHTEALVNSMNFLTSLLPASSEKEAGGAEELPTIPEEDEEGESEEGKKEESVVAKRKTTKKSKFEDVVNLHIRANLECLKVFIRGQNARIAEISIEGLVSEVLMRKKEMEILAHLKNIIILDCDREALYKKAVSIADKEVFAFRMVNYTDATDGDAYLDMTKVDTSVSLTVGCIQVVFLNKFVSSILAFVNNFQVAKEALAVATAQAAEKAASGVMELAERSTRIALIVHFKAPVVFLPQSSTSANVVVADLGLLSVNNHFTRMPSKTHIKIPPIVDIMTVELSELNMYRTTYEDGSFQGHTQLLKPVSLDLSIQRNLSSTWYHSIPDIEITAHLKPMNLILSQDDITVVLRTLGENLTETSDAVPPATALSPAAEPSSDTVSNKGSQGSGANGPSTGNTVVTAAVVETQKITKLKDSLKLNFKFDSMTVVLYQTAGDEVQLQGSHDDELKLGEFTLGTISTSVHMLSDSSMKASVRLANCLLDDKRPSVKMVTPRMVAMRPGTERNMMVEVNYRQGRDGMFLDTVVQDIYLCASMEFLLTVADVFLKASQQGFAPAPQAKPSGGDKAGDKKAIASKEVAVVAPAPASKMEINVTVRNPEIVFVADLTRADAPALVMTTQCELVVACPFLSDKKTDNVTTVLQPCQVFFQRSEPLGSPPAMEVSIHALTLKNSVVITLSLCLTCPGVAHHHQHHPHHPVGADARRRDAQELDSPVMPELCEKRDWKELKMWFLEEGGDEDTKAVVPLIPLGESLKVEINSICVTLEAGVGHRTAPMLLAKSSFHGDVKNWSTLINLYSQLNLEMKTKPVTYSGLSDEVDFNVPNYKTIITISSQDQLNITLSKCGLSMLSNLGTAFAKLSAESFQDDEAPFVVQNCLGLPVSVLYSEMFSRIGREGHDHTVELQDGESLNMDYLRNTTDSDQFSAITSLSGKDYYIQPTPVGHTSASVIPLIKVGRGMYSVVHNESQVTRFLVCQIYSEEGSKYIKIRSPFQIINHFSIPFKVFEGSTCLGTALPEEEFCVPLDSYRSELSLQPVAMEATEEEEEEELDEEEEEEQEFECSEGFSYEDVCRQEAGTRLQQTCRRRGNQAGVLMVNMVPVMDTVVSKHTGSAGENFDEPYVLHLWPSILLRNLLPYPIAYKLQDSGESSPEVTLDPGHSAQLHTAVINQSSLALRLIDYLAQDWSAAYGFQTDQDEITFIVFQSMREEVDEVMESTGQRPRAELDIAVHVVYEAGRMVVAIHSPYWMVNKTGRLLQYKADDIHRKHAMDYDMPLLFSFKPRNFLQNNKVRLMISDSDLSDDFSLDTVGSYGDVKCKGRHKDYLVGVKIDTTSFSLTRIVTFVPFYLLVNRTKHVILISEVGQDQWTPAPPEQSAIPFWPEKDTRRLRIRVEGCEAPPRTIDFTRPENCLLLQLDNTVSGPAPLVPSRKLGGFTVEVDLSEHSAVIRFSDYHDGSAPFLIINHTKDQKLEFRQRSRRDPTMWVSDDLLDLSFSVEEDSSQKEMEGQELEPGKALYYTWAEPTGSRELCWNCGGYSGSLKSEEDHRVDLKSDGRLFLISFYEGLQRVVLFTEERPIYKMLCESEKAQLAEQETVISLQNVGLSLVNNSNSQEVSFIGITSSDVVWESKPKKKSRWKPLSNKDAEMLEEAFSKRMWSRIPSTTSSRTWGPTSSTSTARPFLRQHVSVSLTPSGVDMCVLHPYNAPLRRNYLPAVKVEYSVSPRQSAYRVQVNRIQVRSYDLIQVRSCDLIQVRRCDLVQKPKPLTDISIVTRAAGHSNISRIKYFKVLIQEMDLKLDLGFLYAILDLFTPENASITTPQQEVELFQKDVDYRLAELATASASDNSPISLYEYFHISPIKLHLSLSLSTGGEDGMKATRDAELIPVQSLNLLLKSIGATLTDVQDVVFKLAFFQLNFQFCTTQQLQWVVIRHYSKQAIKQMYVLVLGLDVLGNPFGLIRGLSEGVEAFFYEPYQGAIQGPEEFMEGMALGVKALVGGAVGGIAGAASRITGAMAKGVAAITMDEEYQQKRRETMNTQPSGLKEGLARGGKGLVSGFVSGITGLVTKPIKGAQKEGAAGFFKGMGKGLVGAVARPTGGFIDMVSSTFQGIKRAAETSQDIESLRPPRFIHEDGVIRPYKEREGLGSQMLQKIENGRFSKYRYFAHAKVNESDFLMITKRGIFFVTKGTFGQLTCEWQYLFDEFTKDPLIVDHRRLRIEAKERVKSVFHAKEFGKIINFQTPEIAKWVLAKLEDAMDGLPRY
ncbi:hypothetical protein CRUP_015738 [Coryphaenoides rupestris]|nr:hypothetical protein CRUP_015738 [Coryphaenoides rupestris]